MTSLRYGFHAAYHPLVACALAVAAQAQQTPDREFKATVDVPAYTSSHPKVLFDEAHLNVHNADGTYAAFVGLMKSDGYEVEVNRKPFDATVLDGYQVLMVSNARGEARRSEKPAFTEAECDAVRDWVQAGGALLLVVDHYPTGHAAEAMANRFGVDLGKGRTADPSNAAADRSLAGTIIFARDKQGIGEHAITNGRSESERINRVATFTGESLKGPDGSTALLILSPTAIDFFPSDAADNSPAGSGPRRRVQVGSEPQKSAAGRSQGVAFTFGKGRVVVLGEASQLSAQRAGRQQQSAMGMNYADSDNRQWAINIMHWLSGLM
jgi:hypothetical protein